MDDDASWLDEAIEGIESGLTLPWRLAGTALGISGSDDSSGADGGLSLPSEGEVVGFIIALIIILFLVAYILHEVGL